MLDTWQTDALPVSTVTVNGRGCEVHAEPDTALLYVLRNHLGLKGTRFGCGLGRAAPVSCSSTASPPTRAKPRCGRSKAGR